MDHSGASGKENCTESMFLRVNANVWYLAEPTSSCATSTRVCSDPRRENGRDGEEREEMSGGLIIEMEQSRANRNWGEYELGSWGASWRLLWYQNWLAREFTCMKDNLTAFYGSRFVWLWIFLNISSLPLDKSCSIQTWLVLRAACVEICQPGYWGKMYINSNSRLAFLPRYNHYKQFSPEWSSSESKNFPMLNQ